MKKRTGFVAVSVALLSIGNVLAQAPNVLVSDPPSFVEPGETFESEVRFVLPPGTALITYQLAIGYDPEVLEFVTMEDLFGNEPELLWNDTTQDPLVTGGFARAVLCQDLQVFSPVITPYDGVVPVHRVTFRVRDDTAARSSVYTVLTEARRPNGTVFDTPLMYEWYSGEPIIDATNAVIDPGQVTIGQPSRTVAIDIKPGSYPNSIQPRSRGVIPVALIGSAEFDVADVDVMTLRFGPDGASTTHDTHLQDVNYDGQMDLVCHFRTQETGIRCDDTEATLVGDFRDGRLFEGTDSIRTVGCAP